MCIKSSSIHFSLSFFSSWLFGRVFVWCCGGRKKKEASCVRVFKRRWGNRKQSYSFCYIRDFVRGRWSRLRKRNNNNDNINNIDGKKTEMVSTMVVKSISIYRSSSITKNDGFICSATLYRSDDKRDAISDGLCFIETLTVQSLSFSLFFSLRLDESDQQPQYRHSRIQKKNVDVDDFFRFVCVSAECIRRGIVPDPHPFLRIPCIRRTLVTLKEIFLFYAIATTHSESRLAPHIFSEFR